MNVTRFRSTRQPDFESLDVLLNADPQHPHIHRVDKAYRQTSTWQVWAASTGYGETTTGLKLGPLSNHPGGTLILLSTPGCWDQAF